MSTMTPEVKSVWMKFRRSSSDAAALVLKLGDDNETVEVDGGVREMSPEDLADELFDSNPRWIIWIIKIPRDDGRVQYPIIPIYFSPESGNDRSKMLYSSQTTNVAQAFDLGKIHPLHDLEDMTFDALKEMHISSVTR
uniref:ADF-H domain-containing protein n=1 Tax=Hemiselmis andersenii TaxID=464988 RepID=A0A6U4KZL0_HEMAN|mmetsp:Transcript_4665/g.10678  ORF Transcript_4665/g.10678 Transcript_4665/m.10678 type:complete len:138 (+) Transcript_4665:273-686(+)